MRKFLIPLLFLLLAPFAYSQNISSEPVCIVYFYGDGCPNCAKIKPYIDAIEKEYGTKIHIERYEVYHDLKSYQLYNKFCDIKSIPLEDRKIPLIGIGRQFLIGTSSIRESFVPAIEELLNSSERICPLGDDKQCFHFNISQSTDTSSLIPSLKGKVTLPLVIGAGLIDGINPCAFAVLVFLLMFLVEVSNSKRRMLKAGAAYVVAVYITYFLAGFGIFSVIQVSGASRLIVKAAAVLAILFGIVNIKDYFWYGRGFSLKIPESKKEIIEKWVYKANIPAALVLGFLVSMFELPCTGGVYLAILAMLASTVSKAAAVGYLLVYNLMFVLPLVVIIALVTLGMKAEHVEAWRTERKNLMKLALGLLLLLLGMAMALGWI